MPYITRENLKNIIGLNDDEIDKVLTNRPFILETYLDYLTNNIELMTHFDVSADEIRKLVLNNTVFMFHNHLKNEARLKFLSDKFGILEKNYFSFIYYNDKTFAESEEALLFRIKEIQEEFHLANDTTSKLLVETPLLSSSSHKTDLEQKLNLIAAFNLDINKIKNMGILTNNIATIELKLKLAMLNHKNLYTFVEGEYMNGIDRIFARMKGLENGDYTFSSLYAPESVFKRETGFSSIDLIQKYPLNETELKKLNQKFAFHYSSVASKLNSTSTEDQSIVQSKINDLSINANKTDKQKNIKRLYIYLQYILGLDKGQIIQIFQRAPEIQQLSIENITQNISNLKNRYNCNNEHLLQKTIMSNPKLLTIPYNKINEMHAFLYSTYGVCNADFRRILASGESLFSASYDDIYYYDKSLHQICGFNHLDVAHTIIDTAQIGLIDPYVINAKLELLSYFDVSIDDLINNQGEKDYSILGKSFDSIETKLKIAKLENLNIVEFLQKHQRLSSQKLLYRYIYKHAENQNSAIFDDSYTQQDLSITDAELRYRYDCISKEDLTQLLDSEFNAKHPTLSSKINKLRNLCTFDYTSIVPQVHRTKDWAIKYYTQIKDLNTNTPINEELTLEKSKKLKRYFNLSEQQIENLYRDLPCLQHYPTGTLLFNFNTLTNMGLLLSDILKNPTILLEEPKSLQVKVAVAKLSGIDNNTFINEYYNHDAHEVFARFNYISGLKHHKAIIYESEETFEKEIGYDTALLKQMYEFSEDKINELLKKYESEIINRITEENE